MQALFFRRGRIIHPDVRKIFLNLGLKMAVFGSVLQKSESEKPVGTLRFFLR